MDFVAADMPQANRLTISRSCTTIKELQATGAQSLRALAAGLDERGIPAARGGKWSSVQVMRLLEIIANPFDVAAAGAAA